MAKVNVSGDLSLSPTQAWAACSDLSRFGDWLTIHEVWRSPLPAPDEIGAGTKLSSIIKAKGTRVRFEWTISEYQPPADDSSSGTVTLKGDGKGGVKTDVTLSVKPAKSGSAVGIEANLGGLPLIGLAGKAAAKVIKGDLEKSLANIKREFDS